MTVADYEPFVERMIFRYEGNFCWNRSDPGGPTKFGVTCYDLAESMGKKMDSMARWAPIVRAMSLATADQIYKKKYATACQFDKLKAGCDTVVFDFGVNSGPSRSIMHAQAIVRVNVDGVLGAKTLAAINAYDGAMFVNELCDRRMKFLRGLGIFRTYGRGWTARVTDLRKYSLALQKPQPTALLALPEAKLRPIKNAYVKAYADEDLRRLTAA